MNLKHFFFITMVLSKLCYASTHDLHISLSKAVQKKEWDQVSTLVSRIDSKTLTTYELGKFAGLLEPFLEEYKEIEPKILTEKKMRTILISFLFGASCCMFTGSIFSKNDKTFCRYLGTLFATETLIFYLLSRRVNSKLQNLIAARNASNSFLEQIAPNTEI